VDPSNPAKQFRLLDLGANVDRWTNNLDLDPMNLEILRNLYLIPNNQKDHPNAPYRFYHAKGRLIVFQAGATIYCLNGDTGKKLWRMPTDNLPSKNGGVFLRSVVSDAEGHLNLAYLNQLTGQQIVFTPNRIGAVQASYVAVLGSKGLTVVDPLTGSVLWSKDNIPAHSHVFGDEQHLFIVEAAENGGLGVGRTFRASDGEILKVPDFSKIYQARVMVTGRRILASSSDVNGLQLRLYDILSGKEVWSKVFARGAHLLRTEDKDIAGVIEPNGTLTVLDTETGQVQVSSNLVQGRITLSAFKGLHDPLLLQDAERFYIALNLPIDSSKIGGGLIHSNISNGTRCLPVNGWFVAVHKIDGKKKVGECEITWKKGDFAWHSFAPVQNQMIVLEQFEQSPIVLFTARYMEMLKEGGIRWVSTTQSLQKSNGKMIYDSGAKSINSVPMFTAFQLDLGSRTINLLSYAGSVRHYVK
jgi:outer membrane protein assembly factor BamB